MPGAQDRRDQQALAERTEQREFVREGGAGHVEIPGFVALTEAQERGRRSVWCGRGEGGAIAAA